MPCDPSPLLPATQALLDAARLAYHKLMIGESVVSIKDQNGESVEYGQASASKLLDYINTLNDSLNPNRRVSGPMRLFF